MKSKLLKNYILKSLKVIMMVLLIFVCLNKADASTRATGIANFPVSYRSYLEELNKKYPTWTFTALNTGLTWNTVINNQSILGGSKTKSLSPRSYDKAWHNIYSESLYNATNKKWIRNPAGELLYQQESGWVTSSSIAVAYSMDPRNFLNEKYIFQFLNLSYDSTLDKKEGVEAILAGTEMDKAFKVSYYDSQGTKIDTEKSYADLFMEAAILYNVSPYYLASKVKNETGCKVSTNGSISGKSTTYPGVYNYFNIGAYSSADNPLLEGLKYAAGRGWITPELAIKGGASVIAGNYISKGQYNMYLERFNVDSTSTRPLYTNQYATDIEYSYKQALHMYRAYVNIEILNKPYNFVIPVFNSMPTEPIDIWTLETNAFSLDNTKLLSTTSINILSRPQSVTSTSKSTIITTIPKDTKLTRIAKGESSSYDKVRLDNGIEGYMFQATSNTTTIPYNFSLDKTKYMVEPTKTITPTINIIKGKRYTLTSSDSTIASVTDGVITGLKIGTTTITAEMVDTGDKVTATIVVAEKLPVTIVIDANIRKTGKNLSKINPGTKASELKSKINNTNATIIMKNITGAIIADNANIGTGTTIEIFNNFEELVDKYTLVIYGDVNGDGIINSADLLKIRQHMLKQINIEGPSFVAANLISTDSIINSADLLRLRQHMLNQIVIIQ